jgi:hypothetical protein
MDATVILKDGNTLCAIVTMTLKSLRSGGVQTNSQIQIYVRIDDDIKKSIEIINNIDVIGTFLKEKAEILYNEESIDKHEELKLWDEK